MYKIKSDAHQGPYQHLVTQVKINIFTQTNTVHVHSLQQFILWTFIYYYVRIYSRSFAKSANVGRRAAFRFCVVAVERRFVAVAPSHPAKAKVTLAWIRARTSKEAPTGNSSGKEQLLGILMIINNI